jgi:putative transposase
MHESRVILWGRLPIKRSAIPESLADLTRWPMADPSALEGAKRERFRQAQQAVTMFVEEQDAPLAEIKRRTGVHPEQLYRLLNRCLTTHEDGRIYGFRGLLPHKHVKAYERTAEVTACAPRAQGGAAGALGRLLGRHPSLRSWLERQASARYQPLKAGEVREVRKTMRRLHKQFLDKCKEAHVRLDEWPFNRDELGYRSIQAFVYAWKARTSLAGGRSPRDVSGDVAPADSDAVEESPSPALLPFDAVQFDGHKLDLRLTLRFVDPTGMESIFELTRIFILVCLDVVTRAVLGYHIAISQEYDSDDVAKALQACFGGHKAPKMTIPELRVREGGGFPSQLLEAAQYPGWRWFQYDNAKANLAHATLERLSEITGCYVHAGRFGAPDDRAFIERFFAVLARAGLHQVPGTTGSSVDDIVKKLGSLGSDLHLMMTVDELSQVVEVLLGDYNGESHGGLGGRTPLEAMGYWLNKPGVQTRRLPTAKRRDLIFLQEARIVPVCGTDALHVNFCGVRYTSDVLRDKLPLRGQKIRIYFNTQDIRQLQAYALDGSELGVLVAPRSWNRTPHSLRQRQEINRLVRLGKLRYRSDEDAIEAYAAYKRRQAGKSKKAATTLAELLTIQTQATGARGVDASPLGAESTTPPLTNPEGSADPATKPRPAPVVAESAATSVEALAESMDKPKPKVLSIRRTVNY